MVTVLREMMWDGSSEVVRYENGFLFKIVKA